MSPENDIYEQVRLFLPKYLTPQQTRELFSELSKFPENKNFYLNHPDFKDKLLQGDGWKGFVVINFSTGERKSVSGVILSNSCDLSPDNAQDLPVNVLFSPLIQLQTYIDLLKSKGKTDEQVESILVNIRKQYVTSLFYLPEYAEVIKESIVLLDNIHTQPLGNFLVQERSKLFSLNQYAFYLFLMKLSIHFSRFQEGIARFSDSN